jgi:hypothetical protein
VRVCAASGRRISASGRRISSHALRARGEPTRSQTGPAAVAGDDAVIRRAGSGVQDLRLLDRELLVGEHALLVELAEVLELLDRVGAGSYAGSDSA